MAKKRKRRSFSPEHKAEVIRDRTQAGLQAVRRRGAKLGHPRTLTPEQVEMARTLLDNSRLSSLQVAEQVGVHRFTLYRSLRSQEGGPEPAL